MSGLWFKGKELKITWKKQTYKTQKWTSFYQTLQVKVLHKLSCSHSLEGMCRQVYSQQRQAYPHSQPDLTFTCPYQRQHFCLLFFLFFSFCFLFIFVLFCGTEDATQVLRQAKPEYYCWVPSLPQKCMATFKEQSPQS